MSEFTRRSLDAGTHDSCLISLSAAKEEEEGEGEELV